MKDSITLLAVGFSILSSALAAFVPDVDENVLGELAARYAVGVALSAADRRGPQSLTVAQMSTGDTDSGLPDQRRGGRRDTGQTSGQAWSAMHCSPW